MRDKAPISTTAALPLLLCCACSMTFYGLKEIKEDPKVTACIEASRQTAVAAAPRSGRPTAPGRPTAQSATAKAAPPARPGAPVQTAAASTAAEKPADAEPGPDTRSPSLAARP